MATIHRHPRHVQVAQSSRIFAEDGAQTAASHWHSDTVKTPSDHSYPPLSYVPPVPEDFGYHSWAASDDLVTGSQGHLKTQPVAQEANKIATKSWRNNKLVHGFLLSVMLHI